LSVIMTRGGRICPGDLEHDLIQMPFVAHPRQAATDPIGELLAEFARPPGNIAILRD
jgi:hypothetical protein